MKGQLSPTTLVVVQKTIAEFFREAAVLVGVFGYLDRILKGGGAGFGWFAVVTGATIGLFLLGLFFELESRRPQ
jgi:hypothetical protein